MKIFSHYENIPSNTPLVLTIGKFDAIHLGHANLLQQAHLIAERLDSSLAVVTFANHPAEILRPGVLCSRICTLEHKWKLLDEKQVDIVVNLAFTQEFSMQTAEQFLSSLYEKHPFKALVLGEDARFGKNRQGDSLHIAQLAKKWSFEFLNLPLFRLEEGVGKERGGGGGRPVTSSGIRTAIEAGNLLLASEMLGRPYSIYSTMVSLSDRRFLVNTDKICLPPKGEYAVSVHLRGRDVPATAIIGGDEERGVIIEFSKAQLVNKEEYLDIVFRD